jgi:hypothetical protein
MPAWTKGHRLALLQFDDVSGCPTHAVQRPGVQRRGAPERSEEALAAATPWLATAYNLGPVIMNERGKPQEYRYRSIGFVVPDSRSLTVGGVIPPVLQEDAESLEVALESIHHQSG